MKGKLIYLVDDEENIQNLIKIFLLKEGYDVKVFSKGEDLLERFKAKVPDMVILDIMLPGINGLSVCSEIRNTSDIPIIILSAKDTESDKISGLMLGCDDYLTKPFSPVELVLRVKAIFKRSTFKIEKVDSSSEIKVLDITINIDGRIASCNGVDMKLTPMELNLLCYLMKNLNKGISRDELLKEVWGFESEIESRATDDTIKRIRKKLISHNSKVKIETIWGYGFIISQQ